MADILTTLNEFLGGMELNFGNPVAMATNIILSTIVTGVMILIIVEIFAKRSGAMVNPAHAFLFALIINIINIPIVMGLIYTFVAYIPILGMITMILPVIIWIVLTKFLFRDLEMLHVLIIGVLGFALSIFVLPYIVGMVYGFIPAAV